MGGFFSLLEQESCIHLFYREILYTIAVVATLALFGAIGMFLLVRPLTGGILIHADALEQKIRRATEDLEAQNELLSQANQKLEDHNKRFQRELKLAQNVQLGFLPAQFPQERTHHLRAFLSHLRCPWWRFI